MKTFIKNYVEDQNFKPKNLQQIENKKLVSDLYDDYIEHKKQ